MPPKGRGRARGGGQGPQQPGRPQEHQVQRQPQTQQEPQAVQPPPQQQPPAAQQKPKEKAVAPEDVGLRFEQSLKLTTPFPRKPDPGRLGRPIKIRTNHFPIKLPGGNIYHYDIEIISKGRGQVTEEVASADKKYRCLTTKRNREVIVAMLNLHPFENSMAAYDGRKNLYTRKPLGFKGSYKVDVQMPDENPGPPGSVDRPDNFQVIIKPVNKKDSNSCAISLDPIHAFFDHKITEVPQDAIMAIETILRHGPCIRYTPVGRSFFYPPNPQDIHPLGGGKEIWFGYHQSLRLGQWKPTVNLDITATTFYQKGDLMKYVADFMRTDVLGLQKLASMRDSDISRISKELKGLRIQTTHLRTYSRKYKILKLTRESASKLKFTSNDNGQQVTYTVAQYFAQRYSPLRFANLPCVQVNPEAKKVYLPLEVCEVIEGQHCKKKLEERQNAEMIKFTARPPKQRFNEIRDLQRRADYDHDEYLQAFGISVAPAPLTLTGRVIDPPSVRYDRDQQVRPRDGQWDMRDKQYFRGADIKSWVLLSFANPGFCNMNSLNRFAKLLCDIASEQGIGISRPQSVETIDVRRATNMHAVLKSYKDRYGIDLAVCVVPATNKTIYGDVKQAAETILGLSTQCIKDESVVKKCNPPLVSNLCQKINAKMGGINNSLNPGEKPAIFQKPIIIIGADVTHPAPSHDIKPSIAAAVGSLDAHPSRYAVTLRAQTNVNEKKESIEEILDLKGMILDLLKAFYKNTGGKKPEKIIFYRDGVSEGQFSKVRDFEVTAIREACRTLEKDYQPGITFVVVQKRHHTRFMPEDERQGAGKMKNVPPGTVVDNTVVHPLNFDFFLCSQFGLQGTSRPCHYTVIEDDNNFKADDLQKLTYYLCHTYVRCTKSISSPSPVMYAHLAAFRARQHLVSQVGDSSGSDDSSATYRPLPEAVINAIRVQDVLKNTMYFV